MTEFFGHQYTIAFLGITMAGVSTGFGALFVFLKRDFKRSEIDFYLGFSAGVMLAASFLSLLLPGFDFGRELFAVESFLNDLYACAIVLFGLLLGHLCLLYIHDKVPHDHFFHEKSVLPTTTSKKLPSAILIVSAIALHNFPEGMAVGVGFGSGFESENIKQGLIIALAITIQNLPEGLIVALAFVANGHSKAKAVLYAFLAGMVEPVGAIFGLLLTQIALVFLPLSLGFAAGAMIFVVGHEIIPDSQKEGNARQATNGLMLGVAVLCALEFLI